MDVVIGGVAGQPFKILYELVEDTAIKNTEFRPTLEKIKTTLEALKPLLDEIEDSNKRLKLSESELSDVKKAMEYGAVLIRKCSDIRWHQILKKRDYKNKLDEFDKRLCRSIKVLQVQGVRDIKETLRKVHEIHDVIVTKEDTGVSNLDTSTASCDVPQLPSLINRLDGLKKGLNTDKSLPLVTASGGCGRTLLAQKFCYNPQVKGDDIGEAFGILYDEVKRVTIKNTELKPTLEKIRRTVEDLKPLVDEREMLNEKLDLEKSELFFLETAMEKGAILYRKCSEVRESCIFRKSPDEVKLDEFDDILKWLTNRLLNQEVSETLQSLKKGGTGALI